MTVNQMAGQTELHLECLREWCWGQKRVVLREQWKVLHLEFLKEHCLVQLMVSQKEKQMELNLGFW